MFYSYYTYIYTNFTGLLPSMALYSLLLYLYNIRWTYKGSFSTTTLISIDFFSSCY